MELISSFLVLDKYSFVRKCPLPALPFLFRNKSVLGVLPLSLEPQPNVVSNAFSATKSLIIKVTSLYVSTTAYQFLCLVAPVTHVITFLLFHNVRILDAIISLRNSSLFKLLEGQIISLFSLMIVYQTDHLYRTCLADQKD